MRVEVKAGIRDPEQYPLVEWQEGAEMVSWIMNDEEPDSCLYLHNSKNIAFLDSHKVSVDICG
jgi:hypothetical protein